MSIEHIVNTVFAPVLKANPNRDIDIRGATSAIRSVLRPQEWGRLQFIAAQESDAAVGLLAGYADEILTRINPGFLFVVHHGIVRPVRRPTVLDGYQYMGRVYVALSERVLMTAQDNTIAKVELCNFHYLPKPNKSTSFLATCQKWGTDVALVRVFLQQNFIIAAHQDQVDIFQEVEFNYLHYDNQNSFVEAIPRPSTVPSMVLKKVGPQPEPVEESDPYDD